MLALILKHRTTPAGVLILHDTNEPVYVGNTPLSNALLKAYITGIRFKLYDNNIKKHREQWIQPKNKEQFLLYGPLYYKYAEMTIEQQPYTAGEFFVDGFQIELKEIFNG